MEDRGVGEQLKLQQLRQLANNLVAPAVEGGDLPVPDDVVMVALLLHAPRVALLVFAHLP